MATAMDQPRATGEMEDLGGSARWTLGRWMVRTDGFWRRGRVDDDEASEDLLGKRGIKREIR
jgi:hypothetical protein